MENNHSRELLMFVSNGNKMEVIYKSQCPTYAQFVSDVKAKFDETHEKFTFKINDIQSCYMNDDKAYQNMFLLCLYKNWTDIQINTGQGDFPESNAVHVRNATQHQPTVPHESSQPYSVQIGDRTFTTSTSRHASNATPQTDNGEFIYQFPTMMFGGVQNPESPSTPLTARAVLAGQTSVQESDSAAAIATSLSFQPNEGNSQGVSDLNNVEIPPPAPKKKRKAKENDRNRGEFYPGSISSIPLFDISPEQEPITLRSDAWINLITGAGQEFKGGAYEFRSKLVRYAAKRGFMYNYTRNDASYVNVVCKRREDDGCKWFMQAAQSTVNQTFVVKKANMTHTCPLIMMGTDTQRMGARILGDMVTNEIRSKPNLTPTDIRAELLRNWGLDIKYEKVWRALEVAKANVFGSYDDSFDELRWYSDGIKRTNPGSVVSLETEPRENRFQRFFVAFGASLEGFKNCRPMLFVDGTFTKSKYKGTLLSATGKDGNNGLFPVALAIVDGETSENWTWFIKMLRDNVHHDEEIMYVSDRAGGLIAAFDEVYDGSAWSRRALHFYCLYHLMQNLRHQYRGKKYSDVFKNTMCKLLKDAAYAPNMRFFDVAILKFKQKGGTIAESFLSELPPEKWAVAFAPDILRYGELTSNAAESYNHWILPARSLPITFMVDQIRQQLMKWFVDRIQKAYTWTGTLTETYDQMWNENESLTDSWQVLPGTKPFIFEVITSPSCTVNLDAKTCTCYQWQIRGFPCIHAIAAVKRSKWDIKAVVDPYFWRSTYMQVYQGHITPIPSTERYEFIDQNVPDKVKPPIMRRLPGRPKKKRQRSNGEGQKNEVLCGRCGKYGNHYWSTCKEPIN